MCPLWPAHYLFMYLMVLGPLWLFSFQMVGAASQAMSKYDVTFEPDTVTQLMIGESSAVDVTFKRTELYQAGENDIIEVVYYSDDPNIATVSPLPVITNTAMTSDNSTITNDSNNATVTVLNANLVQVSNGTALQSRMNLTGNFIGYTKVCTKLVDSTNQTVDTACINVSVIRKPRAIDLAFTYSVAALVAIIYINMGAALDTTTIKDTLKRPVGPVIGFFSQFVIMPVLAFGIAKALIDLPSLQLGLFIAGCSPGGGASNIWTLTLGGNLDLSITMTTISTFSAFCKLAYIMKCRI